MERVENSNNVSNTDLVHVHHSLPRRNNHLPVGMEPCPIPETNDNHDRSSDKAHHSRSPPGGGTRVDDEQEGLDAPRHHDDQ